MANPMSMRRPLGLVLAAMVATTAGAGEEGSRRVYGPYTRLTSIAHRGDSGRAPEHTIAAYRLALEAGADFVEPDLQLTKDGVLVCLHDLTLERTTDVETVYPDRARVVDGKPTWPVTDFTLAEIERLDAGAWKGEAFAGARIPTLQQMIDCVRGRAGIMPETKAPEAYEALGFDMAGRLMEVLRSNGLEAPGADPNTPVVIQSASRESLKALRDKHGCRLPLLAVAKLPEQATAEELQAIRAFADGVAPNKDVVLDRPGLVADAHALGLSVTVWTFRADRTGRFPTAAAEMSYFLNDLGVDAVFTNNPDQFPRPEPAGAGARTIH